MNGKWRTCRLLCESGCDIHAKDDAGRTASEWAIERNFLKCAATIAERVHFGTRLVSMRKAAHVHMSDAALCARTAATPCNHTKRAAPTSNSCVAGDVVSALRRACLRTTRPRSARNG